MIVVEKTFFTRKTILTLDDGSQHTFNSGLSNINLLIEAIKQN